MTIRNAIYGIQEKLGAKSKQDIVVWAVRMGQILAHPLWSLNRGRPSLDTLPLLP